MLQQTDKKKFPPVPKNPNKSHTFPASAYHFHAYSSKEQTFYFLTIKHIVFPVNRFSHFSFSGSHPAQDFQIFITGESFSLSPAIFKFPA